MFRVIKESEYVDERQHCFLIQVDLTQCGLKDIQKDLIENLIHSKRLNHSVCQANRHFLCRVYVAMHVSTRTWKRARTNLFTCRAPSWMGTAVLLRDPPSPLPATKSWENHRDLAKNLKSRSPPPASASAASVNLLNFSLSTFLRLLTRWKWIRGFMQIWPRLPPPQNFGQSQLKI